MVGYMECIKNSLIRCLKGREAIYCFLGRIYEKEINEQLIKNYLAHKESFIKYKSITDVDANIKEGFEELHNYLNRLNGRELTEVILELAVDYANLFLGLKHIREGKGILYPLESVYTASDMHSDKIDQIHEMYLKAGLIRSCEFKEPEDHVALQLYFMAYLCKMAAKHTENGNLQDLLKNLKTQKTFLDEHLFKWIPKLAVDVIENADTDFYKAIGKITKGLLTMERTVINELIKQTENIRGKF